MAEAKSERTSDAGPPKRPTVRSTPPPPPPKAAPPVRFRGERRVSVNPRRVRGGVKLAGGDEAARPAGWIQQRIARLVERGAPGEALREGLEYARQGQTRRLAFEGGAVRASVQGRADRAYTTTLTLPHFDAAQRAQIVRAMAEQAVHAAKLLAGELPPNVEDLFAPLGLRLVPSEPGDIAPACTCKEWTPGSPWCKHAVCAAVLAAERLAGEPFLLFGLRGLPGEDLLEQLREQRALPATTEGPSPVYRAHVHGVTDVPGRPLEECLDDFWEAGAELDEVDTPMGRPEVSHLLLRRLGPSPLEGRFPLLGLLATCYEVIGERAREGEGEE